MIGILNMSEHKYDISNLINSTLDQKPTDFVSAFDNLLKDRLEVAVSNKKIELAQNMYNSESSETNEE